MKTKTFRGESVHALMRQVRSELGENVVILNTRDDGSRCVEIEIGLIDAREETLRSPTVESEEPSLSLLADLYRESDFRGALELNGIAPALVERCLRQVAGVKESITEDTERLARALSKTFHFQARIPETSRVIALVGPTGVGKTTTIAKLAARLRAALGVKVGLVAADSYRIGAEYQLEAFAQLLGAPVAMLDDAIPAPQRLPTALAQLSSCDLIFVDTPGSSPREGGRIEELTQVLGGVDNVERLLVLPTPSNDFDLTLVARAYKPLSYSRVILTKVDESGYLGPALNTVHKIGLPLAFLTAGQRVPEDIEPASARRLAWMLMRRMH